MIWALLKYYNWTWVHRHNYRPPFQKTFFIVLSIFLWVSLVVSLKLFHFPKLLTVSTHDTLAHAHWHRQRSNCRGHRSRDTAGFKHWRPKAPETRADSLKLSFFMFVHCFYMENYISLRVYV